MNENFCVKEYTEDKVYLVEELVSTDETGIHLYLNQEGDHLQLPFLCSDIYGRNPACPGPKD